MFDDGHGPPLPLPLCPLPFQDVDSRVAPVSDRPIDRSKLVPDPPKETLRDLSSQPRALLSSPQGPTGGRTVEEGVARSWDKGRLSRADSKKQGADPMRLNMSFTCRRSFLLPIHLENIITTHVFAHGWRHLRTRGRSDHLSRLTCRGTDCRRQGAGGM